MNLAQTFDINKEHVLCVTMCIAVLCEDRIFQEWRAKDREKIIKEKQKKDLVYAIIWDNNSHLLLVLLAIIW